MGDDDQDHDQVDNPQLTWLKAAQSKIAHALEVLQTGFSSAETALGQGAWKGKAGADWEQDFNGHVKAVRSAAKTVEDDLEDEIASKPATVCQCQIKTPGYGSPTPWTTPGFGQDYPSVSAHCTKDS